MMNIIISSEIEQLCSYSITVIQCNTIHLPSCAWALLIAPIARQPQMVRYCIIHDTGKYKIYTHKQIMNFDMIYKLRTKRCYVPL